MRAPISGAGAVRRLDPAQSPGIPDTYSSIPLSFVSYLGSTKNKLPKNTPFFAATCRLLAAQTGNWAAVAQLGKGANDIRDVHYRLNPDERTLRNQDPLREGGPAAEHQEGLGEGIAPL